LFYFAGLYDIWKDDKDKPHKSFTIITEEPNSFMEKIHNRMLVILEEKEEKHGLIVMIMRKIKNA
jgi:putative SOS response-associated peptidase YedK